ncbi:efflux RND transporter periplasmic adaptor subunit [Oscillatoria sp. CS-180]|uniref:efflux RND transporter periplasmic adaptor subunit n=1 Tax=Oscillatoria sp. CS-180 TaxID=3021720 RepID=UPI00232AE3A4|nr:efflux RND transporter periplasmic adaptor subunit [Oscillatoria sp. CS-180]MDB9527405.1 efflux RND transporter periplasmic adaptor subunit [Oscillatoria sp. CS-180]
MSSFNSDVVLRNFLLAIACLAGIVPLGCQMAQGLSDSSGISENAVPVTTADISNDLQSNGVVKARKVTNLSPRQAGHITQVYVEEGDFVAQGELIARMENGELQAQVDRHNALLQKAQAALTQAIAGNRSEEIVQAQAAVAVAQANVVAAEATVDKALQELWRFQQLFEAGAISHNSFEDTLQQSKEAEANLQAQIAQLEEAQASLERLENGTRPEEIIQAQAEAEQIQAQLRFYQVQLDSSFVRAPFAGIITRQFAQAGDFVTPTTTASSTAGATQTSIAELSSGLEIEAQISENNIAAIQVGQTVDISTTAYSDTVFIGKVKSISPVAVKDAGNFTFFNVMIDFQDPEALLKAGMNVQLSLQGKAVKDTLVIPQAAVMTQADGASSVYVVTGENQLALQVIELGLDNGKQVQVLAGLDEGDYVSLTPPEDQVIPGIDSIQEP